MTRPQTSKTLLVKVDGLYGLRFYHQRVAVQGRMLPVYVPTPEVK
jgi:hypothetical protein